MTASRSPVTGPPPAGAGSRTWFPTATGNRVRRFIGCHYCRDCGFTWATHEEDRLRAAAKSAEVAS